VALFVPELQGETMSDKMNPESPEDQCKMAYLVGMNLGMLIAAALAPMSDRDLTRLLFRIWVDNAEEVDVDLETAMGIQRNTLGKMFGGGNLDPKRQALLDQLQRIAPFEQLN
jgi:hypothetical protein